MFERSGLNVMASSQISAQTRVQVLLEYVNEKHLDLEDLAEGKRVRIQQVIQILQLQNEANQVSCCLKCSLGFAKCLRRHDMVLR